MRAAAAAMFMLIASWAALGSARAVRLPAPTYAYDLAVTGVDASGLTQDPQTLVATGVVTAVLRSEGGELPPGPLRLEFYAERDGREGLGADDVRLAERRVAGRPVGAPSLALGATRLVTAVIAARLDFRGAPIGVRLSRLGGGRDLEASNDVRDSLAACRRPTADGTLDGALVPRIVWRWPGDVDPQAPISAPLSVRVGHAPIVMDVTGDDVPDVIVQTVAQDIHPSSAHLRALDGRTGRAHWTVTDPSRAVYAFTAPAAGDLDGDGRPEIVAVGGRADELREGSVWRALAFRGDGTLLWESAPQSARDGDARADPGVTLADVDADGQPEVLAGGAILDGATGAERLRGVPPRAIVADVDRDGQVDLISGPHSFRVVPDPAGWQLVRTPAAAVELTATKLLDALVRLPRTAASPGNPAAGVAHVGPYGVLGLFRLDGRAALQEIAFPVRITAAMQRQGGPPVVADVDGDGQAEIGVAGMRAFAVFDPVSDPAGGLWRVRTSDVPVQDDHYGFTGASAFDLNGDGRWEIAYGDEASSYILGMPDPRAGQLEVLWRGNRRSATNSEMPVIADVNADGRADIVFPNEPRDVGDGITVYGNDAWMTARRTWNQYGYFVDNVADDGTIPPVPQPSWLRHGTFRGNPLPRGDGSANAAANLTAGQLVVLGDDAGGARIQARIGNGGAAPAGPGTVVAFFRNGDETPFARVALTRALGVGRWIDVSAPIDLMGAVTVRAWVDAPPEGGPSAPPWDAGWPECDEADNVHTWVVEPPVTRTPTVPPTVPVTATATRDAPPGTTATPVGDWTPPPTASATTPAATPTEPPPDVSATPIGPSTPRGGRPLYLPTLFREAAPCAAGRPIAVVVVADASASMDRVGADGLSLRISLSRALGLWGEAARASGDHPGLLVFDGAIRAVAPPSADAAAWTAALAALEAPPVTPGSAIDVAVAEGAALLADALPPGRALIVATDALRLDRGVARRAVDAAGAARRAGHPTTAVAVGAGADVGFLSRLTGAASHVVRGFDAGSLATALDAAERDTRCGP